jgi:hypothetical protein
MGLCRDILFLKLVEEPEARIADVEPETKSPEVLITTFV